MRPFLLQVGAAMDELLSIIAELGLELHPDRIDVLAAKIETIGSVEHLALIKSSFGPNVDKMLVRRFGKAWSGYQDIPPREVASALRGASATAALIEARGATELVWTGPSSGQIPVRHTEQVLCEVIDAAKHRLFIVSFVAYEVPSIVKALKDAVERQVQISILLESSTEHGGIVTHDSIKALKKLLPSLDIYAWTSANKMTSGQFTGAVHAKCAVADGKLAFITSANLTTAAMERNIELGVRVKGGELPSVLHQHLEALISSKIVEKFQPTV